jgi:hypothetical protein
VFPLGIGVFKAGGDLAFHHGGASLQELVIPVVTVRMKVRERDRSTSGPVTATGLPEAVTNRIFSVTIQLDGNIPLAERNYNLVELGPRGTGKSYVIQEVSSSQQIGATHAELRRYVPIDPIFCRMPVRRN